MCRDIDSKLASTEAQVNELRAQLSGNSPRANQAFRVTAVPMAGPFQQGSNIPRCGREQILRPAVDTT